MHIVCHHAVPLELTAESWYSGLAKQPWQSGIQTPLWPYAAFKPFIIWGGCRGQGVKEGSGSGVPASGSVQSRAGSRAPLLRGRPPTPEQLPWFRFTGVSLKCPSLQPSLPGPPSCLTLLFSGYAHLRVLPCGLFTTAGLVGLPPSPLKKRKTDYKTPLSIIFNMQNTLYYLELPRHPHMV